MPTQLIKGRTIRFIEMHKSEKAAIYSQTLMINVAIILVSIAVFAVTKVRSDQNQESRSRLESTSEKFGSTEIDDSNVQQKLLIKSPRLVQESDSDIVDFPTQETKKEKLLDKTVEDTQDTSEISKSSLDDLTTVLNVSDADLTALVEMFSKLTGRNYVVDSSVKGKVTIHLPTAITVREALKVFDSVLLLKGFATVPLGNNIWKVIVAKDAKQSTIPSLGSMSTTEESLVTEILKTKHIASEGAQKILSQFVSKDGYSQALEGTNLIILVDSTSNIKRLKSMLQSIDVPPLDQDITIIPIQHAAAEDIAEKIKEILNLSESDEDSSNEFSVPATLSRRRLTALNARVSSTKTDASEEGSTIRKNPVKVLSDERTNSLLVVADEFTTLKVQALVDQLDSEVDRSGGRFWVHRLEHADAEVLSEILSNLISGEGGAPSSSDSSGSSISRSQSDRSSNNSSRNSSSSNSNRSSRSNRSISRPVVPGAITNSNRVMFEDEITVAADPSTNSLVINAVKKDYEKLKQVIDQLDVKRRQVLVEASILEVTLNDEEGIGIELQGTLGTDSAGVFSQSNFGGLTNLISDPSALADLTVAAASVGTITLPGGLELPSQAALLTAVSNHTNVNVLSAPTILSTDNQEAEIIVGENVPFVSSISQNQTNLNNTFNQIERQDVGITLRITPQLGTGDFLSMNIFVEISNVVNATRNDPNGPTTTIRTTDTVVAVKNRQMIVTGGLIQDSINDSTRGIPFLEDVPVLGNFFQRQDEVKRRTNLLIFLTPHIIQDQFDARDQSKKRADQLSEQMEKFEVINNRKSVLESPALDDVFEAVPSKDFKNNIPLQERTPPTRTSVPAKRNPVRFNLSKKKAPVATHALTLVLHSNSKGLLGLEFNRFNNSVDFLSPGDSLTIDSEKYVLLGIYPSKSIAIEKHPQVSTWNANNTVNKKDTLKTYLGLNSLSAGG